MTGCRYFRDENRLVIRPGLFTTGWLVIAVLLSAGGILWWAAVYTLRPDGGWVSGPRDPNEWYYVAGGLALLAIAAAWLRAARRPVVLERGDDGVLYLDGARIAPVSRVEVRREPVDEGPDTFDVVLAVRGDRLRIGRAGWCRDTNPDSADAAAEIVATFLGVPFMPAAAGLEVA